jgi:SAM-dependent methyltransferase
VIDANGHDTVSRFDGLANIYDRHRPHYPDSAIDFIIREGNLGPSSRAVDIGCGTGISTRQLAGRGISVIGVEPNAEMRALAESTSVSPGFPVPEFREGRAEATGLSDGSADLVLSAQAFHWFQPADALAEFHRILAPGGLVVLMWNDQDRSDPFTAGFCEALRQHSPSPEIAARILSTAGEPLLTSPLFADRRRVEFPQEQQMDLEQFLGRAFSASYAPKIPESRDRLTEVLRSLHSRYLHDGGVTMRYRTTLYIGRRTTARLL